MSDDHYVARTYLKYFGDPDQGGRLHAYRKSDGVTFPCWPKDVCHEWEGDKNVALLERQELLGDFRKIFEPHWNESISSILSGEVSPNEKFVVSGYMANLMTCTPAWQRVGQKMFNQQATAALSFSKKMNEKHGFPEDFPTKAVEMIEQGKLKIQTDPDYIKAINTQQLLQQAWITYNQNWIILKNETENLFITSDNPLAIEYSGKHGDHMTRFLPITPHICLMIRYDNMRLRPFDPRNARVFLEMLPLGEIKAGKCKTEGTKHINRLVAQCAEDLVFSSKESPGIQCLVKKYSKYKVDVEHIEFPDEEKDSIYTGTITRVREVS